MEELGQFLFRTPATLTLGGRWVVLSYHSLEDRQVKHAFADQARVGVLRILTKKVVQPAAGEIDANPRARSAKLRAAEKIAPSVSMVPGVGPFPVGLYGGPRVRLLN
jgi:16S rRNA (cytosine1402-N4)-methyltransferase